MEGKINNTFIKSYSKSFSDKVVSEFFSQKRHIDGTELLEFCKPQQINLFILKEVFYKWKAEISKLKSPWFDYDHEEVKSALEHFMNVLSKHISIGKEELKPLVERAVENSLLLIFSPYEFYLKEFRRPGFSRVSKENLDELQKYVKINVGLLNRFIKKFEEDGIEAVFNDDAIRMFNEICELSNETPEDFEPYLSQFSDVIPLQTNSIYTNGEAQNDVAGISKAEEEQLHDKFVSDEQKTLLDDLSSETGERRETLADQFPEEAGIKSSITLNQRFMFVNELFTGNIDEFEIVVNTIENCQNQQEAFDFIRSNYFNNHTWEEDSDMVKKFMDIISRHFSI